MKKIFFLSFVSLAILGSALFLRVSFAGAAAGDVIGWLWGGTTDTSGNFSTGIGWISASSATAGAGGTISYALNLKDSKAAGYAWSSNLGWIDFAPQTHCTTGTVGVGQYKAASCTPPGGGSAGIDVGTGNPKPLTGWARFVDIAKETAKGNAGGLDGWIRIYPSTAAAPNGSYNVVYDNNTGKLNGYAWSELGAIKFGVDNPTTSHVSLVLNSPTSTALLDDGQAYSDIKVSLTWKIDVGEMSSCTMTCKKLDGTPLAQCPNEWKNATILPKTQGATGTIANIPLTANSVRFAFQCKDTNGSDTNIASQDVRVGCTSKACGVSNAQKCEFDFSKFVPTNQKGDATCNAIEASSTCLSDVDCEEKSVGSWKEVKP